MKGLRPYLNCISLETEWTLEAINWTDRTETKMEQERDEWETESNTEEEKEKEERKVEISCGE